MIVTTVGYLFDIICFVFLLEEIGRNREEERERERDVKMCETVLTLRMEEKITKRSAKDMES